MRGERSILGSCTRGRGGRPAAARFIQCPGVLIARGPRKASRPTVVGRPAPFPPPPIRVLDRRRQALLLTAAVLFLPTRKEHHCAISGSGEKIRGPRNLFKRWRFRTLSAFQRGPLASEASPLARGYAILLFFFFCYAWLLLPSRV